MNETLQVIATLIAALWWGGLVTIDLIETPSRFQTPRVERDAILAVGRQVFRNFGFAQLGLGVLLLIVLLLGGADIPLLLLALFMWVLALLNVAVLEPAMVAVREKADGVLAEGTPAKQHHQNLHRSFMAADIFRMILGGILLAALVVA